MSKLKFEDVPLIIYYAYIHAAGDNYNYYCTWQKHHEASEGMQESQHTFCASSINALSVLYMFDSNVKHTTQSEI